jgi:hypothetical protein
MDRFFTELGRTVSDRWKKENFSLDRFPEIACEALKERPPSEQVDLTGLVKGFLLDDEQAFQTQSGFGQPELVVYDEPRFYIQVLFWLEGTTDIHQHEFSGAFHVLQGSSIHAGFHFENVRPVSAHFRLGDLRMRKIELLESGSTLPIISGRDHIHSLFHLDTPSISVVVRTHHDPGTGPQFTYLPPHVGLDPVQNDALTTRRKQLLDVLERTEDPAYPVLVRKMLAELDFERGFFILQNGMGWLRTLGEWEETLLAFQRKHGANADGIAATLDEIVRRDGLVALRASITEPEHRFFLALLMNAPSRADILALVSRRFDGPPEETILRWAEELMELSGISAWILDAEFPEELDIPEAKQPKIFLAALRYLLKGGKAPALPAQGIETLRASLSRTSLRALVS